MKITNVKILVRDSSMKICDLIDNDYLLLSILLKIGTMIELQVVDY